MVCATFMTLKTERPVTKNLVTLLAVVTLAVSGAACTKSGARKIASTPDLTNTETFEKIYTVWTAKGSVYSVNVLGSGATYSSIQAVSVKDDSQGTGFTCPSQQGTPVATNGSWRYECRTTESSSEVPEKRTLTVTYYVKKTVMVEPSGSNAELVKNALADVQADNFSNHFLKAKFLFTPDYISGSLPQSFIVGRGDLLDLQISLDVYRPKVGKIFARKRGGVAPYTLVCTSQPTAGGAAKTVLTSKTTASLSFATAEEVKVTCSFNNPKGLAKATVYNIVTGQLFRLKDSKAKLVALVQSNQAYLERESAEETRQLVNRIKRDLTENTNDTERYSKRNAENAAQEIARQKALTELFAILPESKEVQATVISNGFFLETGTSSTVLADGSVRTFVNLNIYEDQPFVEVPGVAKPAFLFSTKLGLILPGVSVATSTEATTSETTTAQPGFTVTVCDADLEEFKTKANAFVDGPAEGAIAPTLDDVKATLMAYDRKDCAVKGDARTLTLSLALNRVVHEIGSRTYEVADAARIMRNYIEFFPKKMYGEYALMSQYGTRDSVVYDPIYDAKGEQIDSMGLYHVAPVEPKDAPRFFESVAKTKTSVDQVRAGKRPCLETGTSVEVSQSWGYIQNFDVTQYLRHFGYLHSNDTINLGSLECK